MRSVSRCHFPKGRKQRPRTQEVSSDLKWIPPECDKNISQLPASPKKGNGFPNRLRRHSPTARSSEAKGSQQISPSRGNDSLSQMDESKTQQDTMDTNSSFGHAIKSPDFNTGPRHPQNLLAHADGTTRFGPKDELHGAEFSSGPGFSGASSWPMMDWCNSWASVPVRWCFLGCFNDPPATSVSCFWGFSGIKS